ncbi:polysaccharide pyruvyl transferase family protein [Corynebacterium glutamicum]|uniref:polysaccharide pyruvyl transferase family protein n=1 Tax=Corynebacterium glutamicum TaxID=1718 RepID=UPI000744AD58|nr:polysaccharide pyruvyl transferase family protein [Corynebacterium glutamicum]ALZ99136.1 hypothetical protein APT58_02195 [Corynebacterium glutamicum]
MTKTIIIPSCDDGNRGDQALVWQTRQIAQAAGLADECKMITDNLNGSVQSQEEGIGLLVPILGHPASRYQPKSNLEYGKMIFLVWGLISLFDGFRSFLLLLKPTRKLASLFLNEAERETFSEIATSDACFVKGGGFIHSMNSAADSYKAYFLLYHVFLAQSLGVPVYVMPNSFGPFGGALYQFIVRRALKRCRVVTSRESISQNMLSGIGIESERFPDLAFGLESEPVEPGALTDFKRIASGRPIVGITARPYRFPGSNDPANSYKSYVFEMANTAKGLFERGYFPVFVEHVVSEGVHEKDIAAIEAIVGELEDGQFGVFSNPSLNCRQIKSLYGECDFVIGTRFHSVIFALAEGTPAFAVGYGGNKSKGIMKDIGLPSNVVAIEDFTAELALERFEALVENKLFNLQVKDLSERAKKLHMELVDQIRLDASSRRY